MRIIGGELKGRKLISIRGLHTRPTSDRTREAIFNILGSRVHGAMVLDLFAGTGALGIESISRCAEHVFFIDMHKRAISVLRRNIEAFSLEKKNNRHSVEYTEKLRLHPINRSRRWSCLYGSAL